MPTCNFAECGKSAYFGHKDDNAQFCSSHRLEHMINVIDKICESSECSKRAVFNHLGNTSGLYCLEHKVDWMVNVKTKRCAFSGCYTTPIYNIIGESKGRFCIEHKTAEMVNVTGKRCEFDGCSIIAQFNLPNEIAGKFCSAHKLAEMVDIKHKCCEFSGCSKSPSYQFEGDTRPRVCFEHKADGMFNGKHAKCLYKDCSKTSSFNFSDKKGVKFCYDHKLDGMINKKQIKCKSAWCLTRPNAKCDEYCLYCYMNLFPDKPITRNYKTKEKTVVDFVIQTFPHFTWITDKTIQDGCSKRRPDLLLDLGYQIIIIEIDENQHTEYDCSCENKRLMEISQDVGHRPIIFIRFNPDHYLNHNGLKIKSAWALNKLGIIHLVKTKMDEWTERLSAIKFQVEYWTQNNTNKTVEIIQLYYDEK